MRKPAIHSVRIRESVDFDRLDTYNKILTPPSVKFKDLEAIVTSRLSYNVLPFDYRADVFRMTEQASQVPITVQIAYRYLTFKEETTAAGTKTMHATGRIEGRITKLSGRSVERIDDPIEINVSGVAVPARTELPFTRRF